MLMKLFGLCLLLHNRVSVNDEMFSMHEYYRVNRPSLLGLSVSFLSPYTTKAIDVMVIFFFILGSFRITRQNHKNTNADHFVFYLFYLCAIR